MRGYVLQGKRQAVWKEVPVPSIGPYDALVRPSAVATFTTDVHLIETVALPAMKGKVIGLEAVGRTKGSIKGNIGRIDSKLIGACRRDRVAST